MHFSHPAFLAVAIAIVGLAALFTYARGAHLPRIPSACLLAGLLLLSLAAGGPVIALHPTQSITVMVDLSPSTRGAGFRSRAALENRIHELVGGTPARVVAFSDHVEDLPGAATLPDLACEQTLFDPASASAADSILLFSDGRFIPPATAPPTYPVIDVMLENAPDAAVSSLEASENGVAATVRNSGNQRWLSWTGTIQTAPVQIPPGANATFATFFGGTTAGDAVSAHLLGGDLWPENDKLSVHPAPPRLLQRWWVGDGTPPSGWTAIGAADLPTDPTSYLSAGIVALSDLPAEALSIPQQQRLEQYVRDLGGSVLILGGDHAFAAGGYAGSVLESLSPLSSFPPQPTTNWMLLIDGSGSMASLWEGQSRWSAAVDASRRLLPFLPPHDIVSVGSFARDLTWWIDGRTAVDAAVVSMPPQGTGPNGPTNLQSALWQIAKRASTLPAELLLLTDADVTIDDPTALARALSAAKVRVHLLAVRELPPDNPLLPIVTATGGRRIKQDEPARWVDSLRQLMQAAASPHVEQAPLTIRFEGKLALASRSITPWNRTWLKRNADELATADAGTDPLVLSATWRFGAGEVAAAAFVPTEKESTALAGLIARQPRDPRYRVTWQADSHLRVRIDASGSAGYLNALLFKLRLTDENGTMQTSTRAIPQTGPGMYSLDMPAPRVPSLATLFLAGPVIDSRAIAGRYAPEFDAIGNDDTALSQLATRTGGRLIAPSQRSPIDFKWPPRRIRLDSEFAVAGAILLAIWLGLSRRLGWGDSRPLAA